LLGIAAVLLSKYLIVAATGLLGAGLIMEGLEWEPGAFAFIGIALLGIVIQLSLSRPWRRSDKNEEA
jgi:sugar phosphate permease